MHRPKPLATIPWVGVPLALLLWTTPALAGPWPEHREDCETTAFAQPATTDLAKLGRCARLFQAYLPTERVPHDLKPGIIAALKRLYAEGSERDAKVARNGLARLDVRDLPDRDGAAATTSSGSSGGASSTDGGTSGATEARRPKPAAKESDRKKCSPPEPSSGDIRAADRHFKRGFGYYRKKQYDKTLTYYQKMHQTAPGWPKGIYNLAAAYALTGDTDTTNEHLACLADLGGDEAISYLRKARTDSDFEGMRDKSPEFKRLTGYAKMKVGNSLKEYGEDNVDNIVALLKKLGHEPPVVKEAPRKRRHPHIWFKADSWMTAKVVRKVLNHPKTTMSVIDWDDEEFDVIFVWGDRVKKGEEPPQRVPDLSDADDAISDVEKTEREILASPDEYTNKADELASKPGQYADSVENLGQRAEDITNAPSDALDKAEKAGDSLQKSGDKIKGLFD